MSPVQSMEGQACRPSGVIARDLEGALGAASTLAPAWLLLAGYTERVEDPVLRGDIADELGRRVAAAARAAFSLDLTVEQAFIRRSTPGRVADYQSNAAMGLAKRLGLPSREVASRLVEHLDLGDMVESPELGGPGFINFVLRRDWLERRTTALACDQRIGVTAVERSRVVVDYGGPNVAKEMHVGHLRSAIIGDALVRLLEFKGHEVIRRNHLGDWGTPFGMLLEHMVDGGWSGGFDHAIGDLNAFYQEARKKFEGDPAFADRARRRVVALQSGDRPTLELWHQLVRESERHFGEVFRLLGVLLTPEDSYGESFYNPFLDDVVAELESRGLSELSDGAVCVFPPGFTNRDGEPLPLIIRKSGGGYTYAATDLAGIWYWTQKGQAAELVYVIGAPQQLHLQMVFATAERLGWLGPRCRAVHVAFGSVLAEDGKMLRTRSGGSVKLVELLEEAVARAAGVIAERSELDVEERSRVAEAVGIGAVKYADLSGDREKDYVFAWDRMLTMDGNTSVYLQYANARVLSVICRAGGLPPAETPTVLEHPAERALALTLGEFVTAVDAAVAHLEPHRLCTYLFGAAQTFSTFYEECPILRAETDSVRDSRLMLCALTSRVLTLGLQLLGIDAPERL